MKAVALLVITLAALDSSPALAERGWVCTEEGKIQKYRLVDNSLVTEGDPFSVMVQSDNRFLGRPENESLPTWPILINNSDGLIAVSADSGKRTSSGMRTNEAGGQAYVYTDILQIEKASGQFRHITSNLIPGDIKSASNTTHGMCTTY